MNPIFEAAIEISDFLEKRNYRYCIIGGLAVIRWGEIRATQDVDLSIIVELGKEEQVIDDIATSFQSRLDDYKEFALANRTLLLRAKNGVNIDVNLAWLPFEIDVASRANHFHFHDDCHVKTCSAEDLIIYKVFAGRDKDWSDVQGILKRNPSLNWESIENNLEILLEYNDAQDRLPRLLAMKNT